ncbi:hypothetical protein [Ammoniphilus sp. 3BR4]
MCVREDTSVTDTGYRSRYRVAGFRAKEKSPFSITREEPFEK